MWHTHLKIDPNRRVYNSDSKPVGGRNPPPPPQVPQGYAKSPNNFLKFTTSLNPPASALLHLLLSLFIFLVVIYKMRFIYSGSAVTRFSHSVGSPITCYRNKLLACEGKRNLEVRM